MQIVRAVAAAFILGLAAYAHAENYPDRPVKLVVSYPAGGATDVIGRTLAEALSERLGQRVIVDNRGGAGGMVGAGSVAKSPPDGYTLIIATATTQAVNPTLFKKTIQYDALKDFTPIGYVGSTPLMLMAHPSVPANNIQELIAYLKKNEAATSYATGGAGSVPHMSGELFNQMVGIKIKAVHYRGDAPATNDVLGGHLPYIFAHVPLAIGQIREGKLKALGVTTAERTPFAPDLPTIAEQGLPGYQIFTWWGLFGPAGLPEPIVKRLNTELRTILTDEKQKAEFFKRGYDVRPTTPEEFGAFAAAEHAKWGKIIIDSGMQPE